MKERYVITKKLSVPDQLNLARRLSKAFPMVDPLVNADNEGKDKKILIVMMLGYLNDQDSDFIVNKCLSTISVRQEGGVLSRLQTDTGLLMFDDTTVEDICEIVSEVIQENLGDFLRTTLSGLK